MAGESAPDLLTCGICESLIFKRENSRKNCNDDSDLESEVESEPLSNLSMITTVFQYPFNKITANPEFSLQEIQSRIGDSGQSPLLTCHSCSESVKEFYSRFLELRDLIRETSRLSTVINQWGEFIIETGAKVYAKEAALAVSSQDQDQGVTNVKCKSDIINETLTIDQPGVVEDGGQNLYFPCSVCDKVFSTKRNLSRHISSRHCDDDETERKSDPPFSPSLPSERSDIESDAEPEKERSFLCSQCPKGFLTLASLKLHTKRSHSTLRIPCPICDKIFKRMDNIKLHIKKVHGLLELRQYMEALDEQISAGSATTKLENGVRPTTEDVNPNTPPRDNDFEELPGESSPVSPQEPVIQEHDVTFAEDDFSSGISDIKLSEKKDILTASERLKETQGNQPQLCETNTASPKTTSSPQYRCRCVICQRKFPAIQKLIAHMSLRHKVKAGSSLKSGEDEPQYGCPECPKTFPKTRRLTRHFRWNHLNLKYPCPKCGKVFKSSEAVSRHKMQVHQKPTTVVEKAKKEKKKPIIPPCPDCGKSFTRKDYLVAHIRIHTGERPYQCAECGKSFMTKKHLNEHSIVHKPEERNFCCSVCGVSFRRNNHLRAHEKIHLENREKKFVCSFLDCGKSFHDLRRLKYHAQVHQPTKDYSCSECGALFKWVQNLRAHMSKLHGKQMT